MPVLTIRNALSPLERRRVAELGAIADPADPDDLARGLRDVLEQGAERLAGMRDRCLTVTRTTYNWELAVLPYLALVGTIVSGD